MDNGEFHAYAEQVNQLVQRVSDLPDGDARTAALELLQSLMDLHGAVVTRLVEVLNNSGEAGRTSLGKLGRDPLVCGLLVLYGVHPMTLEDRVKQAIANVGTPLRKQGGTVELMSVTDTAVKVKIQKSGNTCGSSTDALKATVEQAILEAAPEVVEILVVGAPSGFVPVNMIQPATEEEKKYEESAA
jgi:Fe-S cluster biogenesis protein NfuA